MDIRAKGKQYKKLRDLALKYKRDLVTVVEDNNAEIPISIIQTNDGKFTEYIRGYENLKRLLILGYNRIVESCPFRIGKCRGIKCQLFLVHNGTGDCSIRWNAINTLKK